MLLCAPRANAEDPPLWPGDRGPPEAQHANPGEPVARRADRSATIRVVIADDHALVRAALRGLLECSPDIAVVGTASDGDGTLAALDAVACDLLLLDMSMPAPCGAYLIGLVARRHPRVRVLVLSMHDSPEMVRAAMQAGARGYVTKDRDPSTLLMAVRQVAAGAMFLEPGIARSVMLPCLAPRPDAAQLSPREREVMQLLVAGLSNRVIAERLGISEKTVSSHKTNLLNKLGVDSVVALVRFAGA